MLRGQAWSLDPATVRPFTNLQACQVLRFALTVSGERAGNLQVILRA